MDTPSLLASIVGLENVLSAERSHKFTIGGVSPSVGAAFPGCIDEVQSLVQLCVRDHLSIVPVGGTTKTHRCSQPDSYDVALVTTRLNRIVDYQKDNLVFAAEAGMIGLDTRHLLARNRQLLPLDCPLFDKSTLGGLVASRASGPARLAHGTPRDSVIGLTVVNAEGEIVKAGGKVVKNVSGYDMCKLYAGSLGTLGVIVETVFKLSPLPERSVAAIVDFENWDSADRVVAAIMDSSLQPRCIELLNRPATFQVSQNTRADASCTLFVGFDGAAEQVEFQMGMLEDMAQDNHGLGFGETPFDWHSPLHQALMDVDAVNEGGALFILRGLPSDVPVLAMKAEVAFNEAGRHPGIIASAANGIVRIVCAECDAAHLTQLDDRLHNMISGVRGLSLQTFSTRGGLAQDTWRSEVAGLCLMKGIKQTLDPNGVFAGGRFVGGI
ncbi:MAG: FAD-binding oxidoreductase [Armatimonadota bacterium]